MGPPIPTQRGITVSLIATGKDGFLYNLSEWGIFKKTIRRYFYRRVMRSLPHEPDTMHAHPVYVGLNGGAPVLVTSLNGDYT